jgi:hypothetical protein
MMSAFGRTFNEARMRQERIGVSYTVPQQAEVLRIDFDTDAVSGDAGSG